MEMLEMSEMSEMSDFPEKVFLQDMFRKEIYLIVFNYFDDNSLDVETLSNLDNIDEIQHDLCKTVISEITRFEEQVDCIVYFDVITLWNVIEYTRKMFQSMKNISSRHLLEQTTLQNCNLAWGLIAKNIIYDEWEDIIDCYQNR